MDKIKLHWATPTNGAAIGNGYGYRVHNDTLKAHVAPVAHITHRAKDALIILPPEHYEPIPGYKNWLFTMFEGMDVPDYYREKVCKADYLITPSTWVKGVFSTIFDPDKIFVVPHGVSPVFKYYRRHRPTANKKFRFLWVGAPNPRKGFEEIAVVWEQLGLSKEPAVELYVKTTRVQGLQRQGNVVLDGRNLRRKQLVKLYQRSHCFLFPTRGEGFGLTLAEAMRTGMPCIATNFSGVTDFFDAEVGYPVGWKEGPGHVELVGRPDLGKISTRIAFPDVAELAREMKWVFQNYNAALEKGAAAHDRIRKHFTWQHSAQALVSAIQGAR